ncbi:murein hydrolase activator EnvC [Synechococcus sp. PCC 7336]|uniref:murein hydrolase activator EnvC family protein n=1 Tax=Synechococcus sp. PCC 7336 TaxID=195250 RepID=UPI00038142F8|nr:peptidoglycan DD-metalloendopeptidase family protein [Synechococcus sp. PCC 7336]
MKADGFPHQRRLYEAAGDRLWNIWPRRGWGKAIAIVGLLLLWLAIFLQEPATAQTLDSLQQERQQIQQQVDAARARTHAAQHQENTARGHLWNLQSNLGVMQTRIDDNEFRLRKAEADLVRLTEQLKQSEEKLVQQKSSTSARLRYLQRQGQERWWALMLSSQDLNDFFDRRYYLKLLFESDRKLIGNLQDTAAKIERDRIALEEQKNEIALLSQQLAVEKQQLLQQASVQTQLVGRLQNQRAAYAAAQRRLEADSQRVASLIQQLTIQQNQASGGDRPQGTGRLQPPVSGPVTSRFGWRVHPIYRTRRLHTGIDYGVATGTPVRAADSGTVIYSGWYGGYGYTVIVNHGNGLTSLYAHNSGLTVAKDRPVTKGQTIARSGSTGLSTGPHVHFEVRRNGQPVNPADYF